MADNTTASLTVSFQAVIVDEDGNAIDGVGNYLSVEVNSEDNGDKTTFVFGDIVYYRVYKSPSIKSLSIIVSDGSEAAVSTGHSADKVDVATFSASNTTNVSGYINSITSVTALGGSSLGTISMAGGSTVKCSKESAGPADPLIGVYRIAYTTLYSIRKLFGVSQPPGFGEDDFDSYPVVIYLIGTV